MEAAGGEQCRQPTGWQGPQASAQCRTVRDRTASLPQAAQVAGKLAQGAAQGAPENSMTDIRGWMARAVSLEWQGLPLQSHLNGRGHQDGAGRLQGNRAGEEALAVHAVGEQHRVPPELAAQDVLHCRRDGCQGRRQVHDHVEELVLLLVVVLHLQAGTVSMPQMPETQPTRWGRTWADSEPCLLHRADARHSMQSFASLCCVQLGWNPKWRLFRVCSCSHAKHKHQAAVHIPSAGPRQLHSGRLHSARTASEKDVVPHSQQ